MIAAMPAKLWRRWQAYFVKEPFGPRQEDLRAGVLAAIAVNTWRGKGKPPSKPADFFTSLKGKSKPGFFDTPEGQDQLARWFVAANGGQFLDRT